ncbi:glycosyltransferase family 39 protein [Candidatus Woesearchaeota archaeon]|nr:glycosyltransferase family 39 protein [Candidatus Woesearchaeota archaeon]
MINTINTMTIRNIIKNIERKDICIAIAFFLLAFVVRLPAIHYPLSGDSVVYTQLTQSIYETGSYAIDGKIHTQYPFLFPLVSAIFMFFGNPVLAIKISAFFWASHVVVIIYLMGLRFVERKFAIAAALLTLFNPWFFYFTTTLPLSEAFTTLLVLLAYFCYDFEDNGNTNYLSAFFFGLAILSRYTAGIFALPFLIAKCVVIIKEIAKAKKDKLLFSKKLLSGILSPMLFILFVLVPSILWFSFTIMQANDISAHGYIGPLLTQSSLSLKNVIYNSFLALIIVPLLLLSGMIIFFAYGLFQLKTADLLQKKNNLLWKYLLISFFSMLLFGIFWFSIFSPYFPYIWEKLRFFVSFIPLLTLFSMISFSELLQRNIAYRKLLLCCLTLFFILSFICAFFITFGFFKENVDAFLPSREIFTQKAYHQSKAIAAINAESNSYNSAVQQQDSSKDVIVILSEQSIRDKEQKQFSYFFDAKNVEIMNKKAEIIMVKGDKNKLLQQPLIYAEYSLEETKQILAAANISCATIAKIAEYGRINTIGAYRCSVS